MKNEKILEMLKENKIEELKKMLTDEIILEPIKSSKSSIYKRVVKQLQKGAKYRPSLTGCTYINEYQYFTNSYWAFKCDKEDYHPLLEQKENYPLIENTFNQSFSKSSTLDYEELKREIKETKALNDKGDTSIKLQLGDVEIWFDYNYLELVIDYLYTIGDKILIQYNTKFKPVKFIKNNSSNTMVLLCPIRKGE